MNIDPAGALQAGPGLRLGAATSFYARMVADSDGNMLGSISDLILDLERGRVAYVVVSTGGFMGMGERMFAVPWQALRSVGQQFVLDCKRAALEAAPAYEPDRWPSISTYGWHERVHAHFHSRPYWK